MDPLVARLLLAFFVGGGTVALFTLAAERLGSRVGGLLLSFPVKVTLTLALVAATESAQLAADAAAFAPAGLAVNVAFLAVAVLVLRAGRGLLFALCAGMLMWLALALLVLRALPQSLPWALAAFAATAALAFALLSRDTAHRGAKREKPKPGGWGILGRALFAGIVVSAAVLSARLLGPGVAGIMSVFPSGFLTSLVILHRAHGSAFIAQTARTMVADLTSAAVYLVVVALAYPAGAIMISTALAVGAGALTSALVGRTLDWWDARVAPATSPLLESELIQQRP